ncbi:SGNH/GDSL hydrolase family protein [Fervidibacillus albus]|uniref:SGNH/GDSL hydrolase family protein n=1 Tax=Fervidibacillus albus TaxID=2980026 RepID=A0A9E8RW62_9BACI|nr:SGNH/GDSL hydrolase family protein [Fervidibacillus albus]WAA09708.1 SGNH/GDSL hydrolase family protein [Fervidibacillus albus]
MIQRILTLLSFVLFVVIIIIGGLHWKAKLNEAVSNPNGYVQSTNSSDASTVSESGDGENASTAEEENGWNLEQLKTYTANLPSDLADIFKQAFYDERVLHVSIVGSPSLGVEENGWSVQVQEQLEETYGTDFLDVNIVQFDGTSTAFVDSEEAKEIVEEAPDLLLLEGFTLEDNSGLVPVNTSHENLRTFLGEVIEANPNVGILIQPPNPIYAAVNYPVQVEELKNFAELEGLHYLDHWQFWPDPNSSEILDYLNDESLPNEEGHKLWADVVVNYFVGKADE